MLLAALLAAFGPLRGAAGQTRLGIAGGWIENAGDQARGGLSVRAHWLPITVFGHLLGVEIGLDRMPTGPLTRTTGGQCLLPDGSAGACYLEREPKDRLVHLATTLSVGRRLAGFAPFATFGIGYYRLRQLARETTFAADGTPLPYLSSPGFVGSADGGLGLHAGVGARYRPAASRAAFSLEVRGRMVAILRGLSEGSIGRNGIQITLGVGAP